MSLLDAIPGYREAIEQEETNRAAGFLPISRTVAGIELRVMTLGDYLALRAMQSPLISGQVPKPEQLTAFLWFLSVQYPTGRRKFVKRHCRRFMFRSVPLIHFGGSMRRWSKHTKRVAEAIAKATHECWDYANEMLMDWPMSVVGAKFNRIHYAEGVGIIDRLATAYHWPESEILAMPMPRVLGYLKRLDEKDGRPLASPSDLVVARWQETQIRHDN